MLASFTRFVLVDRRASLRPLTPLMLLRLMLSFVSIVLGSAMMFWLRAHIVGEDGSSLAIYCMGALFVLVCNLLIFSTRPFNPEKMALSLCIAAVLLTGVIVNLEEKIVLPMIAHNCDDDCVIVYDRLLPFSDTTLVYREDRGWRALD